MVPLLNPLLNPPEPLDVKSKKKHMKNTDLGDGPRPPHTQIATPKISMQDQPKDVII